MANKVTRKFTNATTGAPITGGVYELRSVTAPGTPAIQMTEIVTAVDADKGLYQTAAGVEPGVYKVYKSLVDTGEEITVSPGRMAMAGDTDVLAQNAVAATFHATAFVPETDLQPSIAAINAAITAAATAGAKKVFVGGYRNSFVWQGAAQVTIPDGITLDLGGAEIRCTIADTPPIVIPAGANVAVMNGKVTGTATTGTSRMATVGDTTSLSYWENIQFSGFNSTKPTVGTSADAETRAFFVGCSNVILATPADPAARTRKQSASGLRAAPLNPGGASSRIPVGEANVTGDEVGSLFRTLLEALGTAPSTTPPFADHTKAAEATKQMWFVKVPALEAAVDDIQDQIDSGVAGSTSWSWSRSNTLDGIFAIRATLGAINGATCVYSAQNAFVRGTGENAKLTLQCSAMFDFVASGAGGRPRIGGWLVIDLTEFEAALALKYPSWDLSGVSGLRYSDSGRCFGLYFKGAYRNVSLKSWLSTTTNRPPWVNLAAAQPLGGDGNGYVQFAAATESWRSGGKAVKILIDTQNYVAGTYRAMCSFELEIPASQLGAQAGSGSLGTVVDLPYLM